MPTAQTCDLLICGGVILTGEDAIDGAAVAVAGSRILAVGRDAEIRAAFAAAETIDARGGIVMPGLVNSHNHTPLMITRGMVEDLGFAPAYTPGIPQGHWLSDEETYLLSRLGAFELLRQGSTTVVDYYRKPDACARALAETGLRALVGGRIMDADASALAEGRWRHDSRVRDETLTDNLDLVERWEGHDGGRIRTFIAPHAPDTCSRELLEEVGRIAAARGLAVHTHLCQSRAEVERLEAREGKRPPEFLDDLGLLGPDLVGAHCIHVTEEDIRLMGRRGMSVAHSPIGNASSGTVAPIAALHDAGCRITLCTDTMSGDMFEAMRMALSVARIRGAGYRFKARDVFGWATRSGAAALGLGAEIGVIAPGAKADLVVLDPLAPNLAPVVDGYGIVVHSGSGRSVAHVVVDGRVVLRDGAPTLFDADEVVREARKVVVRLWRRAGRAPLGAAALGLGTEAPA